MYLFFAGPKMKPTIKALKDKTSHDVQREFGGMLGESTQQLCSFKKYIVMNDYVLFHICF